MTAGDETKTYLLRAVFAFLVIELTSSIVGIATYSIFPLHVSWIDHGGYAILAVLYGATSLLIAAPSARSVYHHGIVPFRNILAYSIIGCLIVIVLFFIGIGIYSVMVAPLYSLAECGELVSNATVMVPMGVMAWLIWYRFETRFNKEADSSFNQ